MSAHRGASIAIASFILGAAACGRQSRPDLPPAHYGLGHTPTLGQIAALDKSVLPSGSGLPAGSGTAAQGAPIYAQQCASCHGTNGEGTPVAPKLVGREPRTGFPFSSDPKAVKTIGNYWPYATTVYDYIQRAMPMTAPGSLVPDQIYALTAFLLARNEVIADSMVMDAKSLPGVKMPARDRFVLDDRRGGRDVR